MRFLASLAVCVLFAGLVSSLDQAEHCKCRIKTNKRIVGGTLAFHTDYPWQASVSMGEQEPEETRHLIPNKDKIQSHICGGVIVNERWILTAAHCVIAAKLNVPMSVGVGNDHDLIKIFLNGRTMAKQVIFHPQYNEETMENDIALLELEQPLNFNSSVMPGCLEAQRARKSYGDVVATGYGLTSKLTMDPNNGDGDFGDPSRFLKELNNQDISETEERCQSVKSTICVESQPAGNGGSVCMGDDGGPLHKTQNGLTTIVGVAGFPFEPSFDENNKLVVCHGKHPYTRVGYFIDWIRSYVGDHC